MFLHTAIALYHTVATNCQQGHSADLPQCKRSESGLQTDVFTQNIQGFLYVGKGGQVKVVLALGLGWYEEDPVAGAGPPS